VILHCLFRDEECLRDLLVGHAQRHTVEHLQFTHREHCVRALEAGFSNHVALEFTEYPTSQVGSVEDLLRQAILAGNDGFHHRQHLAGLTVFRQESRSTDLQSTEQPRLVFVRREQHDGEFPILPLEEARHLQPVNTGQAEIDQGKVRPMEFSLLDRLVC